MNIKKYGTRNYEKIYLRQRNLDIDWDGLDEAEYFIHYLFSRILDISENEEGYYEEAAVKKAKLLKKAIVSPLISRKFPGMMRILRDAGHKL